MPLSVREAMRSVMLAAASSRAWRAVSARVETPRLREAMSGAAAATPWPETLMPLTPSSSARREARAASRGDWTKLNTV